MVRRTWKSSTTTEVNEMSKNGMRPVHPGEVIREEFMVPLGLSANALAKALNVPAPRINDVVRGRRGVSADTAMRLARYFGGDARSWLNLQAAYDLRVAEIANGNRTFGTNDGHRGGGNAVAPLPAAAVRPAAPT